MSLFELYHIRKAGQIIINIEASKAVDKHFTPVFQIEEVLSESQIGKPDIED